MTGVNQHGTKDDLTGLNNLDVIISNTNDSIDEYKSVLNSNRGIERRLTQGVKDLTCQLDAYLLAMEQIHISIQRIKKKLLCYWRS